MKYGRILLPVVGLAVFMAGDAFAACGKLFNPVYDISSELAGKRIHAIGRGTGERWDEDHCQNGNLYKVGVDPAIDPAGAAVDPRAYRGTWTAHNTTPGSGNVGTVTYDYGDPDGPYTWRLYKDSGGLCWQEDADNGAAIAEGTVEPMPTGLPCTP